MTNPYKPGDRVRIVGEGRIEFGIPMGSTGTVEKQDQASIVLVKLDDRAVSGFIQTDLLTRQPVEPGCYVRWSDEAVGKLNTTAGWPVHKHRVLNVSRAPWGDRDVVAFEGVSEMVYLSDVVRVADPEPTPVSQPEHYLICNNANEWSYTNTKPAADTRGKIFGPIMKHETCEALIRIMTEQAARIKAAEVFNNHTAAVVKDMHTRMDALETVPTAQVEYYVRLKLSPSEWVVERFDISMPDGLLTEPNFGPLPSEHSAHKLADALNGMSERENAASELLEHLINKTNHAVDPNRLIGIRDGLPARLDQLSAILERFVIKPAFKRGDLVVANFNNRVPIKGHITAFEQGRKTVELMNKFGQFVPNIPIDNLTFARD